MTKFKKVLLIVLLSVVVLTISDKYAWQIYPGYFLCSRPSDLGISASRENNHIKVSISIYSPFHFIEGYKYKVEGDTLYIGAKYKLLIGGTFSQSARYEIPADQSVKKIIAKGGWEEKEITIQ